MTTRRRCSNKPSVQVRGVLGTGIAGCDRVWGDGVARCMRDEGVYYITDRVGLPCGEPT